MKSIRALAALNEPVSRIETTARMFFRRSKEGFDDAVRPHWSVLYRVAYRLTKDPDAAEDILSQALYNAYRSWGSFDGKHLRSWLIRILRNEFLGNERRRSTRPTEVEIDEDLPDHNRSWSDVSSHLNADHILEQIKLLPLEFRLVILLCDVEELSYEEVAIALEIPIGTVRSRLFRARGRMRNSLADFVEEGTSK